MKPVSRQNRVVNSPNSTVPEKRAENIGGSRYLVFGTRIGGAQVLTEMMQAELETRGISGAIVEMVRNVDAIDVAFAGTDPQVEGSQEDLQLVSPQLIRRGLIHKLGGLAHRALHPSALTHKSPTTQIPDGVIILPYMRHYGSDASGRDVPTPTPEIVALCEARGVPYILAEKLDTLQEIGATVVGLQNAGRSLTQVPPSP